MKLHPTDWGWIWPAGLIGAALLVHLLQRWGWL